MLLVNLFIIGDEDVFNNQVTYFCSSDGGQGMLHFLLLLLGSIFLLFLFLKFNIKYYSDILLGV